MSNFEEAILEGSKLVSLNTRISDFANEELEKARLIYQMLNNIPKISKQSFVEMVLLEGIKRFCEETDAKPPEDPEKQEIEYIPEEMTEVVSKKEEVEKPIEDGAFLAKRYGTNIINKPTSIDQLKIKREEIDKLNVNDHINKQLEKRREHENRQYVKRA